MSATTVPPDAGIILPFPSRLSSPGGSTAAPSHGVQPAPAARDTPQASRAVPACGHGSQLFRELARHVELISHCATSCAEAIEFGRDAIAEADVQIAVLQRNQSLIFRHAPPTVNPDAWVLTLNACRSLLLTKPEHQWQWIAILNRLSELLERDLLVLDPPRGGGRLHDFDRGGIDDEGDAA